MAETYPIRLTDVRENRFTELERATGESTRSAAIDTAAEYYIQMAGGAVMVQQGAVSELLELAAEEGSVTPQQIAEKLDADELPVSAETTFHVGE